VYEEERRRNQMISRKRAITITILLLIVSNVATYAFLTKGSPAASVPLSDPKFGNFVTVLNYLQTRYVDKLELDKLIDGATQGLVKATGDPYSSYMSQSEWKELMIRASGNYAGIGVYIGARDRYITVIAPIKGTPAEKAGFKAGDLITKVDGKDIIDMASDKVADMIRGTEGTKVTLTVVREGVPAPFEVEVTRAFINVPAADWKMAAPGIGYIQLREFNNQATKQTQQAITELKAQGAKAFILDLRGNPGGLVDEAVGVSDLFIPAGPVVHVIDRNGKKDTMSAKSGGLKLPLAVLIDGGSASASEIVAGAIQDTKSGTLVGQKSFGKGSVQLLMTLKDGAGLKLTVQKYYTPSMRSIHGIGIQPDVLVEPDKVSLQYQPVVAKRTLKKGDVGLEILAIQERLKFLGYAPDSDGVFGAATEIAVKKYQVAASIAQTGIVDQTSLDSINQQVSAKQKTIDTQLDKAIEVLKDKVK
jgi:carboxyl-terminal processing protease